MHETSHDNHLPPSQAMALLSTYWLRSKIYMSFLTHTPHPIRQVSTSNLPGLSTHSSPHGHYSCDYNHSLPSDLPVHACPVQSTLPTAVPLKQVNLDHVISCKKTPQQPPTYWNKNPISLPWPLRPLTPGLCPRLWWLDPPATLCPLRVHAAQEALQDHHRCLSFSSLVPCPFSLLNFTTSERPPLPSKRSLSITLGAVFFLDWTDYIFYLFTVCFLSISPICLVPVGPSTPVITCCMGTLTNTCPAVL